ncbi:hypothetical protein ANCCAN_22182 [Ancylostoma caninum]|uniref:Uncharacterized protein n=1 Tax=Ancylostoma caninum TaxID=29170 RepID=A0A368FIG8_ANCCA|nr:hypothetical protein ANCCAN_22182 [Ancylostoma caninum]
MKTHALCSPVYVGADCEQPKEFPINKLGTFVAELNRRRRLMVDGNQRNGPNGYLPKGEYVFEVVGYKAFDAFHLLLS